ncbi:thioredoxin-related protein [Rossellomorea marisflavi]
MVILFLLFVVWILFTACVIYFINKMHSINSKMPKVESTFESKHVLIDKNINNIITLEQIRKNNKDQLIMIMSSTCKVCHDTFIQMINNGIHKDRSTSFLLLARNLDEYKNSINVIRKDINIDSESINLHPISPEQFQKLSVYIFPSFILTDDKGIIKSVSTLADNPF